MTKGEINYIKVLEDKIEGLYDKAFIDGINGLHIFIMFANKSKAYTQEFEELYQDYLKRIKEKFAEG